MYIVKKRYKYRVDCDGLVDHAFGFQTVEGSAVAQCRTPEREDRGSRPTAAVFCSWARHFTPRKYWLITQEAMAPSRHDWKIVDWDVKPQHNQNPNRRPEIDEPHQIFIIFIYSLYFCFYLLICFTHKYFP